jgi:3-hydroxybutyryl-CoA dehydrogenase
MTDRQNITVIGAGTMGNGIAHVFAQSGYQVRLADVSDRQLDVARASIETNLGRQVKKGTLAEQDRSAALARIHFSTAIEDSAAGADLVVEAVSENREVKAGLFETLSQIMQPEAVLASNTSSISITWLAARFARPERVIGMHFFNPVPVMKLVEIVRGLETSDETFERVHAASLGLGKAPVVVQDYPGFVSNRILMPMINEAVYCVMENIARPEDIDTVMKLGMAHPMGPLALADLIGLDVCLAIMEVLHHEIGEDKYRPCPLLRKMVAAGRLGRKSGQGFFQYDEAG